MMDAREQQVDAEAQRAKAGRRAGRAAERKAIVAWLRSFDREERTERGIVANGEQRAFARRFADAIECGEHREATGTRRARR